MHDPRGLDERLHAALGAEDLLGPGGAGADTDVAKARVLSGLRRRRARRLQAIGAASVVLLGLAVVLPQVVATSTPNPGAAKSAAPAAHGSAAFAAPRPSARTAATCRLPARTVAACGHLVTGPAAGTFSPTAAEASPTANSLQPGGALGRPLTVRAGTTFVVALPRLSRDWWWATPKIAGTAVYHGTGPPVVVRDEPSHGSVQRFVVTTKVGVTVVLEARESVFSGRGTGVWTGKKPVPAWALELKVEGR